MSLPPCESTLGAVPLDAATTRFLLWAPLHDDVTLIVGDDRSLAMDRLDDGYFALTVKNCPPGSRYEFQVPSGEQFPDPASRSQPDGVHGPSEVVDLKHFNWSDENYIQRPLWDHVIYELHVGTFSKRGTFDDAIPHLDALVELGVSAIELMPVAQFPGSRNWGYDGVFPYCVQDSYGGAAGLQRLVNAAHEKGLAVILDVVYNHLGPEGNVLGSFAPYFNEHYVTPWGAAMNFDGQHSDDVRDYFWLNAKQWFEDFHVDALRLDAIHAIIDTTATPFLSQLAVNCEELSAQLERRCELIAESESNDPRVVTSVKNRGLGMDAQWCDDFHHALHVTLTGERSGYYVDYQPLSDLVKALNTGFVLQDSYSTFRHRHHGANAYGLPPDRLVVFTQNHDQIGNRAQGNRLSTMLTDEQQSAAAALLLLGPNIPMLFMGEEYGETAPFPYFVDHGDPDLVQAVREGRAREFAGNEGGPPPDPASEETYTSAKLNRSLLKELANLELWQLHQRLIHLRRSLPALRHTPSSSDVRAVLQGSTICLRRTNKENDVTMFFNMSDEKAVATLPLKRPWRDALSNEQHVGEITLAPWAFSVLQSASS